MNCSVRRSSVTRDYVYSQASAMPVITLYDIIAFTLEINWFSFAFDDLFRWSPMVEKKCSVRTHELAALISKIDFGQTIGIKQYEIFSIFFLPGATVWLKLLFVYQARFYNALQFTHRRQIQTRTRIDRACALRLDNFIFVRPIRLHQKVIIYEKYRFLKRSPSHRNVLSGQRPRSSLVVKYIVGRNVNNVDLQLWLRTN